MKNILMQLCSTIGLIAGLLIAVQAQTGEPRAKINFDFNIGKENFPAGEYMFRPADPASMNRTLTISEIKSGRTKIIMFMPEENNERLNFSKLIFKTYGSHYYLSEIITPALDAKFRKTKSESELSKKQNSVLRMVAMTR